MCLNKRRASKVLVVFMTYGNSLETWKEAGILERELAIYVEHTKQNIDVHIISYGTAGEKELIANYRRIFVHYNRLNLNLRFYYALLPVLHCKVLLQADWFKTNQLFGAKIAAIAANIFKKPLFARQGYSHFEHRSEEFGHSSKSAKAALKYEKFIYKHAFKLIFTTERIANAAIERHPNIRNICNIVPNYIVAKDWVPGYQFGHALQKPHSCFLDVLQNRKICSAFLTQ